MRSISVDVDTPMSRAELVHGLAIHKIGERGFAWIGNLVEPSPAKRLDDVLTVDRLGFLAGCDR